MSIRPILVAILVALSGSPAPAQVLSVAAAADLRPAMDELRAAFEKGHPGARVEPSFGASGGLAAQIQQGAPFDLFLSADMGYPERLEGAGLGRGPAFSYATGRLVLWVRRDLGLDPGRDGFKVLLSPALKHIALANPAVAPYGRCAEGALKSAGLHAALRPRLVLGESVSQAAQFLEIGAAEAGFISLVQSRKPSLSRLGACWTLPRELHPVLKQGGIVLKRSASPALAEAFRAFLLTGEGRAILLRLGYGSP